MEENVYSVWKKPVNERELREYVRKNGASLSYIPHNRENTMDDDFAWLESGYEIEYHAERRTLVRKESASWVGSRGGQEESLAIPDHIKNEDMLRWYMNIHRPMWVSYQRYEDKMLRDAVLQTGRMRVNGQPLRYETKYHAERRCVSHTRWDEKQKEVFKDERTIPFDITTMSKMVEHVKQKYPYWIN